MWSSRVTEALYVPLEGWRKLMNYDELNNKQRNLCLTLNLLQTLLSESLSGCCGDSFEFLLQTYDLPDSSCILPHLKALLLFGHWIVFILLLRWLLSVPAPLPPSFLPSMRKTEISCSLGVCKNLYVLLELICVSMLESFWAECSLCITPVFCQWVWIH